MIGETIEHFKVISQLGRGGMGDVYRAEHEQIETPAAIKVLHSEISADKDHVQRFFNEARVVSRIKHSGVVKIFTVGYHGPHAFLIMELLEGESLAHRIKRVGAFRTTDVIDVARQTASVLAATHAAGITHRDLKPDNIYLVADAELGDRARVKVLDFGIAKLSGTLAGNSPTTIGTMGTPAYMAPEQWADSSLVDWRVDAYALGCMTFEMVTGRPPYTPRTIAEAYTMHAHGAIPSARSFTPDVPIELDQLISRLLAKQPAERARSMDEVVKELEAMSLRYSSASASGALVQAHVPPPQPPPVEQPRVVAMAESTMKSGQIVRADAPPPTFGARPRAGRGKLWAIGGGVVVAATAVIAIVATRGGGGAGSVADEAVVQKHEDARTPVAEPSKPAPSPDASAAPVVDALTECKELKADRKWQELLECTQKLNGPDAERLRRTAMIEQPAELAYEELVKALKPSARDLVAARKQFERIPDESVYRADAKKQYDAAVRNELDTKWLKKAYAFGQQHKCAELKTLQRQAANQVPEIADAVRAVKCDVVAHVPEPEPEPEPKPEPTEPLEVARAPERTRSPCDRFIMEGEAASIRGDTLKTITSYEAAIVCGANAQQLYRPLYHLSCEAKDSSRIKKYYKLANPGLSPEASESCLKNHLDPRTGEPLR